MMATKALLGKCCHALIESQAREAKLREALEEAHALNVNWSEGADLESLSYFSEYRAVIKLGKTTLALPQDDTALREALHQEWKKGLRDAVGYLDEQGEDFLRLMAKGE